MTISLKSHDLSSLFECTNADHLNTAFLTITTSSVAVYAHLALHNNECVCDPTTRYPYGTSSIGPQQPFLFRTLLYPFDFPF